MGFLDVVMGRRKLAAPAPDRLFAISTAYVTLQSLGLSSSGSAAIVFQPLSSADFKSIVKDTEEVVRATSSDSGVTVESQDDRYGFRWLVLQGGSFDDLVVGINAVSGSLEMGGYGERVLCAVFAFQEESGQPTYWIYNYKRGTFYPFVPLPSTGRAGSGAEGEGQRQDEGDRDNEREMVLKAQIGTELPVEPELERWFGLWGIPI
jgi:hypothetical protein